MKRQIFTLMIALLLATGTVLLAQTYDQAPPPSQQVDQSGQQETGTGPDVDVDTGASAEGVADVDVDATTDPDTAAQDTDMDTTTGLDTDDDNLPETASGMPLLGLIGLLALAGAFAIKAIR